MTSQLEPSAEQYAFPTDSARRQKDKRRADKEQVSPRQSIRNYLKSKTIGMTVVTSLRMESEEDALRCYETTDSSGDKETESIAQDSSDEQWNAPKCTCPKDQPTD
jgi:hypothetical protein